MDFPGSPVVKNSPANAGNMGWIPGSGRFHLPQGNYAPGPPLGKPALRIREAMAVSADCTHMAAHRS